MHTRHCALLCYINCANPVHLVAFASLGLHGGLNLELRKQFNERNVTEFQPAALELHRI